MDLDRGLTPLTGGWSGQTFVSGDGGERVVVRIYPPGESRGVLAPEIDAAVLRLVRGLLPVPDVLEVRRPDEASDHPGLLVTAWMPGLRGDLALEELDVAGRRRMGESMGRVAGTLAGMPTLRPGAFADVDLGIEPFPEAASGLPEWVAFHEPGLAHWDAALLDGLHSLAALGQEVLDETGRTCLVHSDLNPKNVLVDDAGSVVAVLDWEFAHSGHPLTDLGNVLRFETDPNYADAAVAAYSDLRGGDPARLREAARTADLWALVELSARTVRNPVVERAEALLRERVLEGVPDGVPDGVADGVADGWTT